MGLAEPRKRRKFGLDPNNTTWSRSASGFGQKILLAQGWKPGDYLGAKDAAQSDHFSNANASHIRVLLKDDNLGLGAARGQADRDNFGISSLQDLYGRLNGKSDAQLEKDELHRADLKRKLHMDRKYGSLGFVSGGVLVGETTIRPELPKESQHSATLSSNVISTSPKAPGHSKAYGTDVELSSDAQSSPDHEINKVDSRNTIQKPDAASEKAVRREKKAKLKNRNKGTALDLISIEILESPKRDSALKGEPRKERKAQRRQRRLDQRADDNTLLGPQQVLVSAKSATSSGSATPPQLSQRTPLDSEEHKAETSGHTVVVTNQRIAKLSDPRLAVRQRYIKQKRMSLMDPQALKEILMLPS